MDSWNAQNHQRHPHQEKQLRLGQRYYRLQDLRNGTGYELGHAKWIRSSQCVISVYQQAYDAYVKSLQQQLKKIKSYFNRFVFRLINNKNLKKVDETDLHRHLWNKSVNNRKIKIEWQQSWSRLSNCSILFEKKESN